jgi:DNA-binding response OmpR family regulator
MTTKSKPAKPATGKSSLQEKIVAAFHARPATNRAKLLARLARDLGKPVAVAELMKAVYGADDDERGKLVRVTSRRHR